MTHFLFWILISVVIGMLAGLVAMIFGNHKVIKRQDGDADKEDVDNLEGAKDRNLVLIVAVMSVMTFFVIWVANAVIDQGLI